MKRLVPTLLVLSLAGCAWVAPGTPPATRIDTQKLGLSQTAITWPDQQWWLRYEDTQLSQLIGEAIANSPSLVRAQATLDKANAAVRRANASLLPSVDANYSLTR